MHVLTAKPKSTNRKKLFKNTRKSIRPSIRFSRLLLLPVRLGHRRFLNIRTVSWENSQFIQKICKRKVTYLNSAVHSAVVAASKWRKEKTIWVGFLILSDISCSTSSIISRRQDHSILLFWTVMISRLVHYFYIYFLLSTPLTLSIRY